MRVLLFCLALAACATPQQSMPSSGARLVAGLGVSAPAGAVAYCLRAPQECGGAPTDGLRGVFGPVGASPRLRSAEFDSSVFAAMMAARASALRAAPAQALAHARPARHEMALTAVRWDQLRRIGRTINRRIIPTTDLVQFGVNEVWDRPLALSGRARGDCEDYALEKRALLIAAGWPADTLAMAVAMAPGIGLHAVLIAQTDRGDYVLDNFSNEPRPLNELDYVWLSRQVGPRLIDWATASVEAPSRAALLMASAPAASPEALFQRLMAARLQAPAQTLGQTPVPTTDAPATQGADWIAIAQPLDPIAPITPTQIEIGSPASPSKRDTKAPAEAAVLSQRAKTILLAPSLGFGAAEESA